jgi:hypothetical protein
MNSVKTLALVAALFASQSAFATTYDLGDMGPPASVSKTTDTVSRDTSFVDYFSFTLDAAAATTFGNAPDILVSLWNDDDYITNIKSIVLYTGVPTTGTTATTVDKDSNAESFLFRGLTAGSYYFKVSGFQDDRAGAYTFNLATTAATAVPEPEAYAMMLAGLGLIGFAVRRKQAV